jgi:hypothetical protein
MVISSDWFLRNARGLLGHVLTALAILLILWGTRGLSQGIPSSAVRSEPGKASPSAAEQAATQGIVGRLYYLEGARAPVGTVVAFAGTWPPKRLGGGTWRERELGWLRCDGRTFAQLRKDLEFGPHELDELGEVLGQTQLPDYSGYFLRGIGGKPEVNPEASERTDPADPKKKLGDRAGSVQGWSTARPRKPLQTGTGPLNAPSGNDGGHGHAANDARSGVACNRLVSFNGGGTIHGDADNNLTGEEPNLYHSAELSPGNHLHTVERGGDAETRPVNVAVNWIVKMR